MQTGLSWASQSNHKTISDWTFTYLEDVENDQQCDSLIHSWQLSSSRTTHQHFTSEWRSEWLLLGAKTRENRTMRQWQTVPTYGERANEFSVCCCLLFFLSCLFIVNTHTHTHKDRQSTADLPRCSPLLSTYKLWGYENWYPLSSLLDYGALALHAKLFGILNAIRENMEQTQALLRRVASRRLVK